MNSYVALNIQPTLSFRLFALLLELLRWIGDIIGRVVP